MSPISIHKGIKSCYLLDKNADNFRDDFSPNSQDTAFSVSVDKIEE